MATDFGTQFDITGFFWL